MSRSPQVRAVVLALLLAGVAVAQPTTTPTPPKPAEKPKASAVKLPDGTVVFVTRGVDDPNPVVDGVLLSPAEYQALLDQAEAAKKAKDAAKPIPPSRVEVRGAVQVRGERAVAALTLTFTYRTTAPRTVVTLGCQRAAVVAAAGADNALPLLAADADGLTVLAEAAGHHTLTVSVEVPVSPRAAKGEVGFDFALPRAAISSFRLDKPPADGVNKVSVGIRGGELPAVVKRTTLATDQLAAKPFALGPTDLLEVSWEPPGTAPADPGLSAEADVRVKVDERQVETVAKLRLKGIAREWPLTLPDGAEVTVAAGGLIPLPAFSATVVKPTEAGKPWVVRTPADTPGDWLVNVSVRQLRPKPTDPKYRGPYPVGPFVVGGARPTGKVSVYAPPSLRLGFKPAADLRRQDLPATADDDLVAVFATTAGPQGGSWLDVDARPVVGVVRVRPQHRLKLQPAGGWKLESTVRVVPPPRTELEFLTLDVPDGWVGVDVGPADVAEAIPDGRDGRSFTVRFTTPQKAAFDLTLTALYAERANGEVSLPLPRFTQAEERDTKLTATVNDGQEVGGSGFGWENGQTAGVGEPLRPVGRGAAVAAVGGEFDRGAAKVELRWQAYRPELGCESRAEVTVQLRQVSVAHTFRLTAPEADVKVLRFRGPADLVGLRAKPAFTPVAPGEWECRPPADAGREFAVSVQYAARLPAGAGEAAVPLLWCDTATRTDAVVRVWGGGGPRADGFTGRWQELPPEPATDRDSLPWFTLAADHPEPLALGLSDKPDGGGTVIDRGLIQAVVAADGTSAVRAVYALRRWSNAVELDLPTAAPPDILVDGRRVEPVRSGDRVRVPLPEAKPGAVLILDVRCQAVANGDGRGGRVIVPPAVRAAGYRGPVRWYVACPADCVPIVADAGWDAEHHWVWRGYGVGPGPIDSPAEMEKWLRGGSDGGDPATTSDAEAVAVRRATADPLRITLAPRWTWLLAASGVGLVLVAGIAQLRLALIGPAVAVVAGALAAGAVFLPQPTAQAVAAAQPGVAVAVGLLAAQYGWRRYRAWQAERRSTFSRQRPPSEPVVPLATRSSRTGSGGSVVPFEARPT